jgi:uncharacterized protein
MHTPSSRELQMPKQPIFSKLFRESPFVAVQQHMEFASEAVGQLSNLFQASHAADWARVEEVYNTISEIESQADEIKREVRISLPRGLFLPVYRADLLELVQLQDQIPNKAKDTAGLILGRKIVFPEVLQEQIVEFVQVSQEGVLSVLKVTSQLDDLIRSGFSNREVHVVEDLVNEVGVIEHRADEKQILLRSQVHALEPSSNPLDMMFCYKIIELIASITDVSQQVSHRVLCMVAR